MDLELLDNDAIDIDKGEEIKKEPPYSGPERRRVQRRSGHDRRAMVRFELDKSDRRRLEDRRKTTNVWDRGHTLF